jgi:hypothetical protein
MGTNNLVPIFILIGTPEMTTPDTGKREGFYREIH